MEESKLPLTEPIEVVQGNDFTRQLVWSDAPEMTVDVKGPSRRGLKAAIRGGRLTISGRLGYPGRHEITIVEKRTTKITIDVKPAKSWLDTPVSKVLKGERVPKDPPANP